MTREYRGTFVALIAAVTIATAVAGPAAAQRRGRGDDDKPAQAPPKWKGAATVKGKVVDDTGKPIAGARVSFVLADLNAGFFVTTKKNGEFEANDIKTGDWRLQVDAPNFVVIRQPMQVADKNPPAVLVVKRDNSPELLTKADGLFKEGKNAESRVEYLAVLAAHPELTAINRAIAFTYGREKNHPEALKYLDLALTANPNDATLLQLAAASAMEVSDYPRAMGYLGRIDEAALTDPDLMVNAAMNLLNRRRSTDATALLTRMIARFPAGPDAYFYRGYPSMQAGKPAEARRDLEQYVKLAPPDVSLIGQARDMLSRTQ
jgi:Flp pilus assembly protein TadD